MFKKYKTLCDTFRASKDGSGLIEEGVKFEGLIPVLMGFFVEIMPEFPG